MVLIPISKEIAALIDKNRDDLSRSEFIELYIKEYFENIAEEKNEKNKDVLEEQTDDRVLVPLSKEIVELIDENRDDLSRWKFIEFCMNEYLESIKEKNAEAKVQIEKHVHVVRSEKKIKKDKPLEISWKRKFDNLWFVAFLSYGAGDVLSSYLAFANPLAAEGNPVLRYLFNDNFYAFVFFKIAVLGSLLLLSYYYIRNKPVSLFVPVVLILVGIWASINNLLYLN